MIIGIDGNEANVGLRVGIGQYAYNLILGLKNYKNDKFIIFLKNQPKGDMPPAESNWQYRVFGPKFLWTRIGLPLNLLLSADKLNVFFSPTHYAPIFSPCPTVVSVMDLSYIYFPEMFRKRDLYQLTNWTRSSIANATKIITISHFSKKTIIDHYKLNEDKVVVTYPGFNKKLFNNKTYERKEINTILSKYGILGKYILFVGTLQPRKNLIRLIAAFDKFHKSNIQLVLVGKKGWLYGEILKKAITLISKRKIVLVETVYESELPYFYKGSECLILPSLYEGFGLPVIEAMACGCPVIASNISSLPEIVGNAAESVDPYSVESIRSSLEKVLTDKNYRNLLIERGLERAKYFSWLKCARETYEVLKSF